MDRIELTRIEMLNAIDSVSPDLDFTMEICEDFEDRKLPTLFFSLFIGDIGIEHTYYEKTMKNQTLLMERSSLGTQQKMSIMTNELQRRLEVIGENLPQIERNEIVEKYTKQLINSENKWKQVRNIIVSGLKGQKKK